MNHFTLAYTPWTNGTVEVVCRELLRAVRSLNSEFQLPLRCWPSVLPVVQSALNNAPLKRLCDRCPLTALTGLPQETPLRTIKTSKYNHARISSISEVRSRQTLQVKKLQSSLEDMPRDIKCCMDATQRASVASHNQKTNIREVNFDKGDYDLRAATNRRKVTNSH